MTEEMDRSSDGRRGTPGWMFAAVGVLGIVALVGLVMAHNASTQGQENQQSMESKVKAAQVDFTTQIAQLQQHQAQADTTNAGLQSDLSVVTKRLRLTQGDLKKAREEAETIRTEDQQKIDEVNGNVTTVTSALATKASTDDVKGVDGKVDVVRTDLTGTQNDLKMARSELGTLIASNHEQIEQLRRLGERDYIEFTIDGKNKPQKVELSWSNCAAQIQIRRATTFPWSWTTPASRRRICPSTSRSSSIRATIDARWSSLSIPWPRIR